MQVSAKNTSKNQITVEKPKTHNLWDIVEEQRKKYGNIDTPEIDWGSDVGEERLD